MEYIGAAMLLLYAGAQLAAVAYVQNMESPLKLKYSANNDVVVRKPRTKRARIPAAEPLAKAA
jgi:hypothetical protein